ncbi:MAG: fused MFS/spermidine synthase [Planctomycetes bacterium]|nr:fused MFS/spermidine synthase [Planctomycetota bacterium]
MASTAVWLLFFLSGACGLIYEVLWTRHLGLILGNTTYSLSAVLSAFMAGLALGSYLAGRWLERRLARGPVKLLRVYGVLECAIGLYCALLPWLFDAVAPVYAGMYGEAGSAALAPARFMLSFLLLLVPTTCMGATLPVLSQFMTRTPLGLSRAAGTLYAVNTFGAVAGAAGAGFILLPWLGRSETNGAAVAGNLILGLLALLVSRWAPATEAEAAPAGNAAATAAPKNAVELQPEANAGRVAALAFGITGFAAMSTQIGWTRALSLSIGSSTYAFSLIVAVFILGLALGGTWGARVAAKLKDPAGSLAFVLLLIGLFCMALVTLLGMGPVLFFWLIAVASQWSFPVLMLVEALGIALLLLVPTFLMGATMPLTLQAVQPRAQPIGGAGRMVGTLYAINTAGSILGSLAGGLLLLPLIQIQSTLQVSAALYALPGLALFFHSQARRSKKALLLAGGIVVATLVFACTPRWDPLRMSSGAYLLRSPDKIDAARAGRFGDAIPYVFGSEGLYYKEGVSATVAVMKTSTGMLTLTVGGKPDATSGPGSEDMSTQVGLTLIPELLHANGPKDVLVIGMGSGVSAGAALTPPSVERVDVVEISPEVMEASWYFREWNGLKYASDEHAAPLAEPKIQVLINDGRNHLRLTSRSYDVIASEPSNPWIAGIGNLFTREAFELCRKRLKPGGIFSQWLHRYQMSEREFKSVMATFADVFPHMQIWCVLPGSDYLLVGSEQPLEQKPAALLERMRPPAVNAYLKRVNFHVLEELLACFMADRARVKELCESAEIHTDDNMLLEFAAPRTLYFRGPPYPLMPWRVSPERMAGLAEFAPAERRAFQRRLDLCVAGRACLDRATDHTGSYKDLYDVSLSLSPGLFWAVHEERRIKAEQLKAGEKESEIEPIWTPGLYDSDLRAAEAVPPSVEERQGRLASALENLGAWKYKQGFYDDALKIAAAAEQAMAKRPQTALLKARIYAAKGDVDACITAAKDAEDRGANGLAKVDAVAEAFLRARRYNDVLPFLENYLSQQNTTRDPALAVLWARRAEALVRLDKRKEAIDAIQRAIGITIREPAVHRARVEMGLLLTGPEALAEAVRGLDAFRAFIDPRNPKEYFEWGDMELRVADALSAAGRSEEALEHRRRGRCAAHAVSVLVPECPLGWRLLARAWKALGDPEAAKPAEEEAQKLETPQPQ